MRDHLRRLLHRHSIEVRDPIEDQPFKLAGGGETYTYCDVRKTILLPHGLYGISRLILETFVSGEGMPDDIDVGAVAGPALGGIPLAAGLMLAAYEFDHQNAPPMLLVRKQTKEHGTGNLIEGLGNVEPDTGILIVEDVVTSGGSTLRTIEALREAGMNPTLVITVVDREQGGMEAIRKEGVTAVALFTLEELTKVTAEDHVWFRPDPAGGEGYYFKANEQGWEACDDGQNEYLDNVEERHVIEGEEPDIFFVDGIFRV